LDSEFGHFQTIFSADGMGTIGGDFQRCSLSLNGSQCLGCCKVNLQPSPEPSEQSFYFAAFTFPSWPVQIFRRWYSVPSYLDMTDNLEASSTFENTFENSVFISKHSHPHQRFQKLLDMLIQ